MLTVDDLTGSTLTTQLLNKIYPVGSIYISYVNQNPSTFLGGTWSAFASGRTLVGINTSDTDFATVGKTGGSKTVTLSVDEMPKHYLTVPHIAFMENSYSVSNGTHTMGSPVSSEYEGAQASISGNRDSHKFSFGSGSAHNNLQPYITVYMWRRTA